jgi:methylmalonyl-CoA/ethylmalonyl-CoA epimerase
MKLHHIGIASDDLKSSILRHKATFNMHPISEIINDTVQRVKVVLLSSDDGGMPIELIAPLTEDSPVAKALKKENRLYHICFEVDNIDLALGTARKQGAIIVSKPMKAKLHKNKRIAFIYTRDKYLVEFVEK